MANGECGRHSQYGFAWGNTSACSVCRAERAVLSAQKHLDMVLDNAIAAVPLVNRTLADIANQFGVTVNRVEIALSNVAHRRRCAREAKDLRPSWT